MVSIKSMKFGMLKSLMLISLINSIGNIENIVLVNFKVTSLNNYQMEINNIYNNCNFNFVSAIKFKA